jgi:hypothetical protein
MSPPCCAKRSGNIYSTARTRSPSQLMDEPNSKDAEVRARVPAWMYNGMAGIAKSRGEQMPVILREAVAEYLASRVASGATPTPTPTAANILHALRDRPDIAETLIVLGQALKANTPAKPPKGPVNYTTPTAEDVVDDLVEREKRSRRGGKTAK